MLAAWENEEVCLFRQVELKPGQILAEGIQKIALFGIDPHVARLALCK